VKKLLNRISKHPLVLFLAITIFATFAMAQAESRGSNAEKSVSDSKTMSYSGNVYRARGGYHFLEGMGCEISIEGSVDDESVSAVVKVLEGKKRVIGFRLNLSNSELYVLERLKYDFAARSPEIRLANGHFQRTHYLLKLSQSSAELTVATIETDRFIMSHEDNFRCRMQRQ